MLCRNQIDFLPAPLSFTRTCSDMVIFEELDALLRDEYMTQHIQIARPTMLSVSNVTLLSDFLPIIPSIPGLHFSSIKKNHK